MLVGMAARAYDLDDPAEVAAAEADLAAVIGPMTDEQYQRWATTLAPDDAARADDVRTRWQAEQERTGWRATPFTMARHLEGDAFADYRHTQYLCDRFVDAHRGVHPYQIWSLPAQVGKSWTAQRCVAWALDDNPALPIIYTSYGTELAQAASLFVRDYGEQHADQLRYRIRPDARKIGEWRTTAGGGLKATGMRGSLSGFPAGGLFIDDPHKNWQEAHSVSEQERVWDLYRSVLRLRLRMGGWIIVLHTRWCEGDLTGRLREFAAESGEQWLHVRLPMLADSADDPLGRAIGEPLEPRRYDLPAAQARAVALGSYLSAALEQQDPQPLEGNLVKRSWWHLTDDIPDRFDELISSWDTKMKDVAAKGDFVVGQVWGRTGATYWLLDQFRGQWTILQVKVAVALAAHRWGVRRHYMENTGNGPEVMAELTAGQDHLAARDAVPWAMDDDLASAVGVLDDERDVVEAMLRRGVPGLLANTPQGSKDVRAIAVSGVLEAGNVRVRRAPFAEVVISEAVVFPNGTHDDTVDAWSQALAILSGAPGTTSISSPAAQQVRPAPPGQTIPRITRPARGGPAGITVRRPT